MEGALRELVEHARQGDEAAFAALVRRYQGLVHGTALATLRDGHAAEDVAQETFLALHAGLHRVREPGALPGFLRSTARHLALREVRRRGHDAVPLEDASEPVDGGEPADQTAVRAEETRGALRALARLPRRQREVVVLYYLHECSQAQVARLLGLSESVVNNRLHAARQALKRKVMQEIAMKIEKSALPDDFADRVGRVVRVAPPFVDVRFDGDVLPAPLETLVLADEAGRTSGRVSVVQRGPSGLVRCVSEADAPGEPGAAATVAVEDPMQRLSEGTLHDVVAELSAPADEDAGLLETGIKSLDLLCPLPDGGRVGLVGPMGTGRVVFLDEIAHRLASRRDDAPSLSLFSFMSTIERDFLRRARDRGEDFFTAHGRSLPGGLEDFYLPSQRGGDPELVSVAPFDVFLRFDIRLAARGFYPALDPQASRSRVLTPDRAGAIHVELAQRVRDELAWLDGLVEDPAVLELLANGAFTAARTLGERHEAGVGASLAGTDRVRWHRARKLRAFLTTPFHGVEEWNGFPGKTVPLADTLATCAGLLDGDLDGLDEACFLFTGGGDDVRRGGRAADGWSPPSP